MIVNLLRKDSETESTDYFDYAKWRNILNISAVVVAVITCIIELIVFWVKFKEDDLHYSVQVYLWKNIFSVLILNATAIFLCRLFETKSGNQNVKNFFAILALYFPSIFASFAHYTYPEIVLVTLIPLLLSTVYGNEKLVRGIGIVSLCLFPFPFAFCLVSVYLNHTYTLSDCILHYLVIITVLIIAYISAIFLVKVEQEKYTKITEYAEHEKKVNELLKLDSLTNLYNNLAIKAFLSYELDNSQKDDIAVAMLDIDNFKGINDTYGHLKGDEMIVSLANFLKNIAHPDYEMKVARYGGDEFCIVFKSQNFNKLVKTMNEAREVFEKKYSDIDVTFSCGLYHVKESDTDATEVIEKADKLLYAVKNNGKNALMTA